MFHRILIPLDNSTCIPRAVRVARDLARQTHAEIVLVHVEPQYNASPDTLAEAMAQLERRTGYLRSQGVHTDCVVAVGHRDAEIAAIARARQVDLILDVPINKHQMELEWYSQGATHARTEMPAPMLIWPVGNTYSELLENKEAEILVPVDGSPVAERALPFAIKLAESYGRSIMLVRVVPQQPPHPPTAQGADEQYKSGRYVAYQYLTDLRSSITAATRVPILVRLGVGDPATEILRLAEQQHTCAIVACAHSHARRDRFFLGGVATQIVRQARGPVLIVPPHTTLDVTLPMLPTSTTVIQMLPPLTTKQ